LHDSPIINYALKMKREFSDVEIIPVFCFDPRFYTDADEIYETRRCGLIRSKFMLESVLALRDKLESIGNCMLISMEKAEDFLCKIAKPSYVNTMLQKTTVVFQREATVD
jgi:deoxyribodipyrimidine photo-lyase